MPDTKDPKWGAMKAGESHLSEEWHDMNPSSGHMSEKWVDMEHSSGHMSEKWIEMEAGSSDFSDRWHEMKQEGRMDPYAMHPSTGDRTVGMKEMKKEKPEIASERSIQHTEFGSTREI